MTTPHRGSEDDGSSGTTPDDRLSGEEEDRELLREARQEINRSTRLASVFMLVLIAAALGLAWWTSSGGDETADPTGDVAQLGSESEPVDEASTGEADTGPEPTLDPEPDGEEDQGDGAGVATDDLAGALLPDPPTDAPYVDATLADEVFVLSGVVPSNEVRELLESRAEVAYAPFNSSRLEVDESLGGADWLGAAAEVVALLPMITDGTIRLQDDSVTLVGRSPNPQYAAGFQQAVGQITGLPVSADGIEITNLAPPRFVATVEEGAVTLEGEIASDRLIETLVLGAAAVYGPENVTSTMTVDEGTYTSFWNYTMPGVFQVLARFPSYRIQVENGVTSGTLRGGVVFDVNSADITPDAAEALTAAVAVLSRDRSITMTIVGHTDDRGPDEVNQRLSLARAQSAVDFLIGAGVDPAQLIAEGRGSDEPIGPNDTPEGRALNRRIEFLLE